LSKIVDVTSDHLHAPEGVFVPYSKEPLVFEIPDMPIEEAAFHAKMAAIGGTQPGKRVEVHNRDGKHLLMIWTKQVYTAEVREHILAQVREHVSQGAIILRADAWVNQPPL
jgi:hypothetical protein